MNYSDYISVEEKKHEQQCARCGACCGAHDDPCKHLSLDKNSKYYCHIYDWRFGLRETVGGEKFNCVNIREILDTSWTKDYLCRYKYPKNL